HHSGDRPQGDRPQEKSED
ncbi:RNA chaperone Hfq, partial [Vibrio parahaemolyticus AQ3810]